MANDLTTAPQTTNTVALSSAWQLPKSLQSVVEGTEPVATLPVCSPEARGRLQVAIDAEMSRPVVDRVVIREALASMAPSLGQRRQSDAEAKAQLDMLEMALAGMPIDIFHDACTRWVKISRFMPAPADLLGYHAHAARSWRLMRMRAIILRHDREWTPAAVDTVVAIPDDEIAGWSRSYQATALNKGWITQAQFDAVPLRDIDQAA